MVDTRGGRRFAVLVLIAALLVLLLGRWLQPVNHVALTVAAPFNSAISGVSNWAGDTVSGIFDGPRLRQEVAELKQANGILVRQKIASAEALHENQIFRHMLRFFENNSRLDLLPARVIATDANSPLAPYILINRGTRDALRRGMTVVDQSGYFVGRVVDLTSNDARVELMLSPSLSVGAYDMRSRATGLVDGVYAGPPSLNTVVESASLQKGDLILTSGQFNLFPRDLPLGVVVTVHHRNVDTLQSAIIQPAADFQDLEIVSVVRNSPSPVPARLIPNP